MKRDLLISMLFSAVAIEHAEAEANVAGLKSGDFLKWPRVAA
jgi:hypothetical protein